MRTILMILLVLCCTGCTTTNSDMIQAADDMELAADKIDAGELDARLVPPLLREHAKTLRAWGGQ